MYTHIAYTCIILAVRLRDRSGHPQEARRALIRSAFSLSLSLSLSIYIYIYTHN